MSAKRLLSSVVLVSGLLLLSACGKAEIGGACETKGKTDECVEGAVCDTLGGGSTEMQCLKICTSDADCNTATEACTGVSGGNVKACHKK